MAPASTASPSPSRRCSGSSSRAPCPTARTAPPIPLASSSHSPTTSLAIAVNSQPIGSEWAGAGLRAGARPFARAPPVRLAAVRAEEPPLAGADPREDLARGADPFGFPSDARVAMIRG